MLLHNPTNNTHCLLMSSESAWRKQNIPCHAAAPHVFMQFRPELVDDWVGWKRLHARLPQGQLHAARQRQLIVSRGVVDM